MINGIIVEQVPPTAADWLGGKKINEQHINSDETDHLHQPATAFIAAQYSSR